MGLGQEEAAVGAAAAAAVEDEAPEVAMGGWGHWPYTSSS